MDLQTHQRHRICPWTNEQTYHRSSEEWGEIVNWKSVSVQVTPYGLQQNLIVRRVDKEKLEVHVQGQGCPTMDYFYMIIAERSDIENLNRFDKSFNVV